ncbi:amidohydrolase family protein [Actinoplanes couchii]|uniref:Amidohydrolase (Aminocarboxymuconate-semialdehyde decarboxylase) n=1 Tax=Actinoplanes couchii TaxID=403638 RepID=A0ABQ3XNZ0_9ACTN|nr:amidohydrolase family protein [Actinoplanes couchii]MDR6318613.1 aminocarboxymuconate-semialdehyde decarboxylase [Actinoplanes couchii]GID60222.1 putative amidohydrolase (aminocarboxymuconate-semialdehyde decarboxylase) [Actinoplanes couchii]
MRIDVHAHYWAASYLDRLVDLGRTDLARAGRQRDDLDERLAEMDTNQVDVQILSAIGLDTYVGYPDGDADACRHINDVYASVTERYRGRFTAFASVPLPWVGEAVTEAARALDDLRLAGIALPCSFDGRPIDDPAFEPFWAALAERNAAVYVHPVGSHSACHPGLADWGLHTAYGSPTQIAAAAVRIAFSGISTRYPQLRFIFAMCGGTLPLLWKRHEVNLRRGITQSATAAVGRGYFAWIDDLPIDRADPMSLLRNFWYDTAFQDVPEVMFLVQNSFGTDRLLLGSDAIFASLTAAVDYISDSPYLSEAEKHQILDVRAAEVLRLPGPSPI